MKKPKIIHVIWHDHYAINDGWCEADYSDTKESMICETVGFLMKETKESLFIALSYCEKEGKQDTASTMVVLKCCLVKRRYLK